MIKILTLGDPHFKVKNVIETDLLTRKFVERAQQEAPTIIVVLGDVLDRFETIHVSPLCRALDLLSQLREIAPLYILIGNHDMKNNRQYLQSEHPFTACKLWPNTHVVDQVLTQEISGQRFTFAPYVPTGRFVEALDTVGRDVWLQSRCIFAHQEFKGVVMHNSESINGDEWQATWPLVVSGHIHQYSRLGSNIIYTGTAYQTNFGEHDRKTVSLFEFPELNHENSDPSFLETRIDLGLPGKKTAKISARDILELTVSTDDMWRIIIEGTAAELQAIKVHPKYLEWIKAGHKIELRDCTMDQNIDEHDIERYQASNQTFVDLLKMRVGSSDPMTTSIIQEIFSK